MIDVDRVVVVGTGLLGGSLGLALRAAGYAGQIVGVGRRQATVDRAGELGCIDRGTTDLEGAVRGGGLVVLATPLGTFTELFGRIASSGGSEMVVTDVGSTKAQVCRDARRLLPQYRRFVGSHPMAGSDRHGPDRARADLFRGKPCVVTADQDVDEGAVVVVESLWTTLGMRLQRMTSDEHDRKVAAVSHLPHLLASLLVGVSDEAGALDVASTGFGDVTRLARSDPNVWLDIFASNRGPVGDVIERMIGKLEGFARILKTADDAGLLAVLHDAKRVRDAWDGPEGGTVDYDPNQARSD